MDYKIQKWDPTFAEYIDELAKKKPLIVTGDFNCAHQNMDVHSPWTNKKTPGFTEVCFPVPKQLCSGESLWRRLVPASLSVAGRAGELRQESGKA